VRTWLKREGFKEGDLRSERYMSKCYRSNTPIQWAHEKGERHVYEWLVNNGALVPGEEQAVRKWHREAGFHVGDLRSPTTWNPYLHPICQACFKGELNVCKWLHEHGAAPDITKANKFGTTPMLIACQYGHMSVCKWLFEVGAAVDIGKASNDGYTPMYMACLGGKLSVCKWLFEVGAAADITKASNDGFTPMYAACQKGHLSVCEWLFGVGAAADITKKNRRGDTPILAACKNGHLSVCKWLVFNGALKTPTPTQNDDGHVDQAIVKRDTLPNWRGGDQRPALLAWARDVAANHHTFLHVVLRASVILSNSHQQASPDQRCYLPRLPRVVLERLGDFLGVEMGRRVRNVREFAEALAVIVESRGRT
jgi:ankyrin repeat protein